MLKTISVKTISVKTILSGVCFAAMVASLLGASASRSEALPSIHPRLTQHVAYRHHRPVRHRHHHRPIRHRHHGGLTIHL